MKTLTEPAASDQLLYLYRSRMQAMEHVALAAGTKYALCLLKLHPAVTPANYAQLRQDICGVTGIADIEIVVDHETRSELPADTQLAAVVSVDLRIEGVSE